MLDCDDLFKHANSEVYCIDTDHDTYSMDSGEDKIVSGDTYAGVRDDYCTMKQYT
jgi:hypothetical protein